MRPSPATRPEVLRIAAAVPSVRAGDPDDAQMRGADGSDHTRRQPHGLQGRRPHLADYGRKEIQLAEHEMPGLMAMRERYGDEQAARRRPHRRLAAHDDPDRRADRDPGRASAPRSAGPPATSSPPRTTPPPRSSSARRAPPTTRRASRSSPGRARRWRSTGGAPSRSSTGRATASGANMILDDGGDATMLRAPRRRVREGRQAPDAGLHRQRRVQRMSSRSSRRSLEDDPQRWTTVANAIKGVTEETTTGVLPPLRA